jgi:hypothetical protein
LQGRVEISIYGYESDKRELFEIKAVRKWFKKAEAKIKPWFYFLNTRPPGNRFKLLMGCSCDAKVFQDVPKRLNAYEISDKMAQGIILPRMIVKMNEELMQVFFEKNFSRLNEITENLGMSIQENKEISGMIFHLLNSEQAAQACC